MVTTEAERDSLVELFRQCQKLLGAELVGASEAQLDFRPAPDCWSMRQIAEHVAVVEEMLYARFASARPSSEPSNRLFDEKIHRAAPNRTRAVAAPEGAHPTGRFPTPAAALEHLRAVRAKAMAYAADPARDLRGLQIVHPAVGTPIDMFQFLLIMAYHPRRHAGQIAEMKGHPSFPQASAAK